LGEGRRGNDQLEYVVEIKESLSNDEMLHHEHGLLDSRMIKCGNK
jgi:hypothetical protein